MESIQWDTTIPSEPTACLVFVSNISSKTEQATLQDFFSFCGVIKSFEMKPDNNGKQAALVLFEEESSAKTATLLSQAEIDELPIQVEYYFKQQQPVEPEIEEQQQQQAPNKKSASHVMAELLASGYVLTENVIAKGVDFDEKHGGRINGYFNKMSGHFTHLHQKFSSSNTSNEDLSREVTSNSTGSSTSTSSRIKNSRAGMKLHGYASRVANKVSQVHEEAKRIAAEKNNEKNHKFQKAV